MQSQKLPFVTVLFFGATADAAGARKETLELRDSRLLKDAVSKLMESHPRLSGHKLMVAVNEEYADWDTALENGDELAVFTAVSGG